MMLVIVALAVAGTALAQPSVDAWELEQTEDRFTGRYGTILLETVSGSGTAELRLGCTEEDPTLPTLLLLSDSDLGDGPREVYARILGLSTTTENVWRANGSELVLSGFDAALLLSDIAGSKTSRALFLRLEGDVEQSWSASLRGFSEVLEALPCASNFV